MSETNKAPRKTSRRPLKARLGIDGYVRLLAYIKAKPGTIIQIAQGFGIGRDTTYKLIGRFYACGWLHVVAWHQEGRGKRLPVYTFGKGIDAPKPTHTASGHPIAQSVGVLAPVAVAPEVMGLCALLDELESECNLPELVAATGLNRDTVKKALDALVEHKLAHIALLLPRAPGIGGEYMRYWKLGAGQNAKMPHRKKREQERGRRYREASKAREFTAAVTFALAGAANHAQAEQAA